MTVNTWVDFITRVGVASDVKNMQSLPNDAALETNAMIVIQNSILNESNMEAYINGNIVDVLISVVMDIISGDANGDEVEVANYSREVSRLLAAVAVNGINICCNIVTI